MRLRKSSVQDYAKCPLRFKLRWVDNLPGDPSYEAELGTAFHEVARKLMEEGKPPLEYDLERIRNPELRSMIRWFIELENRRWRILKESGYEELWRPYRLEWEVEAEVTITGRKFILTGHIDRVDKDEHGRLIIVEYKTTRGLHLTDWRRELTYYKIILRQLGYTVSKFVVINPMRREYIVEDPSPFSEHALKKLLVRLANDDRFDPKPGEHCVFCPVRRYCPLWGVER